MVTDHNFEGYITDTARLSILKAKAASTCKLHPDILILSTNMDAQKRAYRIAVNTLVYHDKLFLEEHMINAVGQHLDSAGNQCIQCLTHYD
jgi:hypothetical protein